MRQSFRTIRQLITLAEAGAFNPVKRPTPTRVNYVQPRHALILAELRAAGQPMTAAQLAERIGRPLTAIRTCMTQMKAARMVRRVDGPPASYVPTALIE